MAEQDKLNIYDIIKAKIIEKIKAALESGEEFTWAKPWEGAPYPCNYDTPRQPFRCPVNRLLLETGEYLTFWQINKLHAEDPKIKIRKGAKQVYVFQSFPVFQKDEDDKVKTNENGEPLIAGFRLKYSREFHISDVVGLKSHFVKKEYVHDKTESMHLADQLIRDYCRKYKIKMQTLYGAGEAYFQKGELKITDPESGREEVYQGKIMLPDMKQFKDVNGYYATIFHELGHSTKVAIDRDKLSYPREELVAEISASLTCASLGFSSDKGIQNNAAYLQSWLKAIEGEGAKEIYFAVMEAQKATDLIFQSSPVTRKLLFPEAGIIDDPVIKEPQEQLNTQLTGGKRDGR